MTAPNEPFMFYGLRHAQLIALNANGLPAATSSSPYEGVQAKGSVTFELNFPEPRKITGLGEDGITQEVFLPPTEGVSGKLTVEADDPEIAELLTLNKVRTLGDATLMLAASSNQGFEPQVGLLMTQAMVGLESGKKGFRSYASPSAMLVMQDSGMNADKGSVTYNIAPNRVSKHLWGETFTTQNDGALSAQLVKLYSNNMLRLTSFLADGVEDEFSFPVDSPSANATPVVYVNGVKKTITTDYTATTAKITFVTPPADEAVICVLREVAV